MLTQQLHVQSPKSQHTIPMQRTATSLGADLPDARAILRLRTMPSHTVNVRGVSQTMLQTLAIRAFRMSDALAMSLLRRLNFDFSTAARDEALSQAVVARTLALDSLTASYIAAYPRGVVVNLAAGLDTRFHRLHTADVTWFNVDLPDVADARARLLGHSKNLFNIAADATTAAWAEKVNAQLVQLRAAAPAATNTTMNTATRIADAQPDALPMHQPVLVLMEGLSMYLNDQQMRSILHVAADAFPHAMFVAEALTPHAAMTAVMPSISVTGSRFTWGADHGDALHTLEPRFRWSADVPLENREHYLAILTR